MTKAVLKTSLGLTFSISPPYKLQGLLQEF